MRGIPMLAFFALVLSLATVAAVEAETSEGICQSAAAAIEASEPVFASHGTGCHAELDCGCQTIRCEGQSSCTVGSNSVTCDGQTTQCPTQNGCTASTTCPDGSQISCSAPCAGDCTQEPGCWVACDDEGDGFDISDFTWCPGFEGCLICPCGGGF